jgi:hypothetical protein
MEHIHEVVTEDPDGHFKTFSKHFEATKKWLLCRQQSVLSDIQYSDHLADLLVHQATEVNQMNNHLTTWDRFRRRAKRIYKRARRFLRSSPGTETREGPDESNGQSQVTETREGPDKSSGQSKVRSLAILPKKASTNSLVSNLSIRSLKTFAKRWMELSTLYFESAVRAGVVELDDSSLEVPKHRNPRDVKLLTRFFEIESVNTHPKMAAIFGSLQTN